MARTSTLTLSLACCLALSACAGKDDAAATAADDAGATAASRPDAAPVATPAVPRADLARPLADYRQLDSGQQVMFLYVAASRLPADFEKLAQTHSREYRSTSDTFRRRDLMAALKPQLEEGIAEATASPYLWMDIDDAQLQPYDFERKGFIVNEFESERRRWFSDSADYQLGWQNNAQVTFAPVADEGVARQLEGMRGKWDDKPRLRVYFFAQAADLNVPVVKAYVTHVQLRDRSGQVLAQYSADQSQPGAPAAPEPCVSAADCAAQAMQGR